MGLSRRTFVVGSAAGLVALSAAAAADANSTIGLATGGVNNRGSQLATGFAKLKESSSLTCATQTSGQSPRESRRLRLAVEATARIEGLPQSAPRSRSPWTVCAGPTTGMRRPRFWPSPPASMCMSRSLAVRPPTKASE